MLQRELPGQLRFCAWWRPLPCGGGSEYLSRTLQAGASAHELLDFYLDDGYRPRWAARCGCGPSRQRMGAGPAGSDWLQ